MNVVGSIVPVIFLLLSSVSSQSSGESSFCTFCIYDNKKSILQPELLWATPRYVLLRTRLVCSQWCLTQMVWFYTVPKEVSSNNYSGLSEQSNMTCEGNEYCRLDEKPGTQTKVYTAFYSEATKRYIPGPKIKVKFCPETPPPKPKKVTCLRRGEIIHVSWRHEPDECQSYVQYMVQTGTKINTDVWKWIGEIAPGRHSVPGNDVIPCPDKPNLFCTNITNTSGVTRLKLGVRRMYTIIFNESIAETDFIDCSKYKTSSHLITDSTEIAMSFVTTTIPIPKYILESKCTCKNWHTIGFVLSGALLIIILLLPLTFYAGMRLQILRNKSSNSSTPWHHLNGNQLEWNRTLGRQELICNEALPDYAYDYTYSELLRIQSRLPGQQQLPPTMHLPPGPQGQSTDVQNDLYVPDPSFGTRSNRRE